MGEHVSVTLPRTALVPQLKTAISASTGVGIGTQVLYLADTDVELEDTESLLDAGVSNGATVFLMRRKPEVPTAVQRRIPQEDEPGRESDGWADLPTNPGWLKMMKKAFIVEPVGT